MKTTNELLADLDPWMIGHEHNMTEYAVHMFEDGELVECLAGPGECEFCESDV